MATFQDITTFSSSHDWTLTGRNALVKAVSVADAGRPAETKSATGYFTQAKYLKGRNATQIETDLGLRPLSFKSGAYIFYFARLPLMGEFEQRFTANMPGGKPWDDAMHDEYLSARDRRDASGSNVIEYYPEGSSAIRQWELVKKVPLSGLWKLVTPSMPFEV